MLCSVGLFSTLPWGFTSFSSVYLQEEEGLSVVAVGYLLPCMGVAQIISTLVLGQIGNVVPHKLIMLGALSLMCAGSAIIVFLSYSTDSTFTFASLLLGYSLYGFGFAPTLIIPFRQVAR